MTAARLLAAGATICLALLAASCSTGFSPEQIDEITEPTALASEPPAEGATDTAATSDLAPQSGAQPVAVLGLSPSGLTDGPLNEDQYEQITRWFDAFLDAQGRYFSGQTTLDELQPYTSDRSYLVAATDLQAEYVAQLEEESLIAISEWASFSNIDAAAVARGAITFEDCTEVQTLSLIGIVGFRWIKHRVAMQHDGTTWVMSKIEVVHDGQPWTSGFGCTAQSFDERATALAVSLFDEYEAHQKDPSLLNDDSFAIVKEPAFRRVFVTTTERQQAENLFVVAPQERRYDVQGLDVGQSLIDWSVVVDVCVRYPLGFMLADQVGSTKMLEPNAPPSYSLRYRLATSLEAVELGFDGDDAVKTVDVFEEPCW